jgi:hypothetical protein
MIKEEIEKIVEPVIERQIVFYGVLKFLEEEKDQH